MGRNSDRHRRSTLLQQVEAGRCACPPRHVLPWLVHLLRCVTKLVFIVVAVCPAGRYSVKNSLECVDCDIARLEYQDAIGQDSCKTCACCGSSCDPVTPGILLDCPNGGVGGPPSHPQGTCVECLPGTREHLCEASFRRWQRRNQSAPLPTTVCQESTATPTRRQTWIAWSVTRVLWGSREFAARELKTAHAKRATQGSSRASTPQDRPGTRRVTHVPARRIARITHPGQQLAQRALLANTAIRQAKMLASCVRQA